MKQAHRGVTSDPGSPCFGGGHQSPQGAAPFAPGRRPRALRRSSVRRPSRPAGERLG
jgi:hypothetical protein